MHKLRLLMFFGVGCLLTGCEAENEQPHLIIPQGQLDALDKAKNLESELLKIHQQKEKQLQQTGL